jgi:phosphatidylethanolamine/phosphatidyl-N-methylethanolamine N-methyltransferase
MNRIEKERLFWDSFAKQYDSNRKKPGTNEAYEFLFRMFRKDVAGAQNLLEAATGTGLISLNICDLVSTITAMDLSPEMLKIAKRKAISQGVQNIDFQIGDICEITFPDYQFDVIIASNVLHLLFEPDAAIQELKRVLKPGGKIIVPTYCHGENLKSHLFSRCMNLIGFRARSRWSISSFEEFIEKNGFEISKKEKIEGIIPMLYLVAKPTQH